MTTSTWAVPDDFPHFSAWFGQVPGFEHLRVDKKFNCRDQIFRMRQLVDGRYYLNWHYADSDSYSSSAYFRAIEDFMCCRQIYKLPMDQRPVAMSDWFTKRQHVNDVWEYRTPPLAIGKFLQRIEPET
eukprot:GEMP01121009.1.p1 GENE.GEMP01121009.1~~GEMP01121009.1.p1  ORF type:complete len:128 (+),score=12.45 GEMP01121009.1:169-552(+)